MKINKILLSLSLIAAIPAFAIPNDYKDSKNAVEIYSEDHLLTMINKDKHLKQIKKDKCQLVQDIDARARIVSSPAYQFLWGDMLTWGICVPKDEDLGLYYIKQSAHQGLPAAIERLGRYYSKGIVVQKDQKKATIYLRKAAKLGNKIAIIEYAEQLIKTSGSSNDYIDAYFLLKTINTTDRKLRHKVSSLLDTLKSSMPSYAIKRANRV